jgi:purine-binding chemotaxis protein CheW
MVDAVRTVLTVAQDKIEPALSFGNRLRVDFIDGMINIKDRFVVALDVHAVFSVEELSSLIGVVSQDESHTSVERAPG